MKTFTTTDGTAWELRVNVGTIKRVHDETGLRLTDLFATNNKMAEFFSDDLKFCEVLFATVRPQAEKLGKTVDDFLSGIDGTVITEAVGALMEELADFFPEPRKGLLKKAMAKYREAEEKVTTEGVQNAERMLTEADFETLIQQTRTSSPLSSPVSAA